MEEPLRGVILPLEKFGLDLPNGLLMVSGSVEAPSNPSVVYTDVNIVPEHEEGLGSTISSLQEEILSLRSKQRILDGRRREALNKILDLKGSIRVFCRIRSSPSMDSKRTRSPISTEQEKITIRSMGVKKEFNVDRVFCQESTQEDVFLEVEPIVRSAIDGHNVCILAYGQTGTGKTYTMEGVSDKPGIVPQTMEELFRQVSQDKSASYILSMSMLEVYVGSLRDLLAPKRTSSRAMELIPKSNLSILAGSTGAVEVEGLTEVGVADFKQASRWYAKGKRARSTSWTNVNETSSRSHCLTRITISQSGGIDGKVISKLWLVDLGGSERLLKTGATGQTMDEGKAINLSLSALGDVIAALRRKRSHIPYRNSKLTQILSDSLGEGSKVLMIVHISPSEDDVGETVCSLSFAKRVRSIEPNRELTEDLKRERQKCIMELEQQIHDTEEELKNVRDQIERAENLIQEKKKLFSLAYQTDDQKGSPRSPLILDHVEVSETPKTADKTMKRASHGSVPHFMASTACSRHRQSTTGEVTGKVRTVKLVSRSHADLFGSQSFSFSSAPVIPNFKSAKIKPEKREANPSKLRISLLACKPDDMSHNSVDSKASSVPRNRKVSNSHPNLRATFHQHQRRMSDLT
ncbi:kinesin-like protein KIN-14O [Typha latifolia]|uniref:kinesin-like protein KIN-14O n=1 Tax=Typha latifolia TaxID=4733 RepID=UPI003C2EC456